MVSVLRIFFFFFIFIIQPCLNGLVYANAQNNSLLRRCTECHLVVEYYTDRIDSLAYSTFDKLKQITSGIDKKRLSISYHLVLQKGTPPYDVRFYQHMQWPAGLAVTITPKKQATDRGVETFPSAIIRYGSDTAVIPVDKLTEAIEEIVRLNR